MSFARSLSIADAMEEAINKEARVISLMMLTGLSKVSPVDTGRFRGNWFVSLGQSDRTTDDGRRVSTAVSEGGSKIAQAVNFSYPTITLSNNLPYAEKLNEGHSQQAPAKFIEQEIDRVTNARFK